MKSATKDKEYTSPVQKLVRFFEKSRDQWKAKCHEAKAVIKRLKSRHRFLQQSRERWRQKAQKLGQELAEAKARERGLRAELEKLKGGDRPTAPAVAGLTDFAMIPPRHQYSVGHAALFIRLVLSDATSLRCAGRVMETVFMCLQLALATPAWSTGRFWEGRT